ncbi:MAG: response regulator [Bryobacteraceae bacterium]|nr:response regulator [Bryobacteraceae bacterium]
MTPAPGRQTFRILLMEDNPADIYLLRRAVKLADLSIEFTVLNDGAEGLAFANGQRESDPRPDLLVLDLNLPKTSGAEVLRAMKSNPVLAGVPVVVMSSSSSPQERAMITGLGVARYLTKPPNLEGFMKVGEIFREVLLGRAP